MCDNGTRVCHALTSDFLTTCNVYLNILVPGTTIQPPLGDLKRVVCGSCRDLLRRKISESVAVDREDADVTPSKKRRLFLENSGDGRRARIREKGQLISCDSWRGRNNETLHSILRSFNGSTLAEGGKNKLTTAVKQYKCVTGVGDAAASIERKRRATEEETRFLEERKAEEDAMCQFRVGDHVSDSGNTMSDFCGPLGTADLGFILFYLKNLGTGFFKRGSSFLIFIWSKNLREFIKKIENLVLRTAK